MFRIVRFTNISLILRKCLLLQMLLYELLKEIGARKDVNTKFETKNTLSALQASDLCRISATSFNPHPNACIGSLKPVTFIRVLPSRSALRLCRHHLNLVYPHTNMPVK